MKPLVNLLISLMLLGITLPAHARDTGSGFYGQVDLGGGFMRTQSHLDPGDDNKRISAYTQSPKSETEFMPAAFFELGWRFGQGQTLYIGMPQDGEPRPTLGWASDMGKAGEVDFSVFYGLPDEVWEDPYLLNTDRKETDMDTFGGKIQYRFQALKVSYELTLMNVDKDLSGQRLPDLKRDGATHKLELAWEFDLGQGFSLEPSIGACLGNMDGDSSSFKGGSAGIGLTRQWDNVIFHAMVQAGINEYDKAHPVFTDTRKDKDMEAAAMISWLDPLGFEKFSLSLGTGYGRTSSNIDFYDGNQFFTLVSIGYRFGSQEGRD